MENKLFLFKIEYHHYRTGEPTNVKIGIVNLPALTDRASRRNTRLQIQSKTEKCIPAAVAAAYATSTVAHIGYIS